MEEKDANSNPLAPEIEEQVVNTAPQGKSKFAVSPLFHDMLRWVALGHTFSSIAVWSTDNGYPIKAPQISKYLQQHLPHLQNPQINKTKNDAAVAPIDPADAMERQCKDLERSIAAEKCSLAKHGVLSSQRLLDLQKANGIALGQLGRIKLDRSRMKEIETAADTDAAVDIWEPEFAAAVAQLIVEERSKEDGKLRRFQPKKLEDEE